MTVLIPADCREAAEEKWVFREMRDWCEKLTSWWNQQRRICEENIDKSTTSMVVLFVAAVFPFVSLFYLATVLFITFLFYFIKYIY